jgi:hypothetical protein
MKPKVVVRQVRLVLRIIAVGIWINTVFNYTSRCLKEAQKPPTKEVMGVFNDLPFPTILVCNTMQGAPLENKQVCINGPKPSELVGDRRKCIPVESIVFQTPEGLSFCLKFEAPKDWRVHVKRDPIILKSEIDLPDMLITLPFGQRELILPAGLNVIVLNTASWEEAVKEYNSNVTDAKTGGHRTYTHKKGPDFGHYMDEMSRSSSVVLVGAGKFANIIVRAHKWRKLDGSSKTRYSVDDSSRPRISSKSVFINVAFASEDVRETVEYLQFDWYQVFGLSAAVAVFLDIGIRVYMFFVGRMISTLCGAAGEIIPEEETQGLIGNEESEASLEERILGVDSDDDDL